jgi:hypothetical protein
LFWAIGVPFAVAPFFSSITILLFREVRRTMPVDASATAHCWLLALLSHAYWMTAVPAFFDLPVTSKHLPLFGFLMA